MVRGDVSGGWEKDDGSWADFSIRLYVATPDELSGRTHVPATPLTATIRGLAGDRVHR